jgi:hypothetical protein
MQKSGSRWISVGLEGMPAHILNHLPAKSLFGLKALLMEHGLI